ncbi:Rne/Rng family ribonuclease [Sagittula sp. SSi028]|uniref:Rne/Rng family ribonuclease n=1 Tax=Sagittula sp. SSi028 TaxID=3400636 RepID=UPI003AF89328
MAKKMLIDATHAEETRVVVVDGNKVEEFDFESENKRQLAGNIYLAKVTRVEPSLQAAFVDYGGNRHGFLAFSEIHPDYYQIPVADRKALMEEEAALAAAAEEEEDKPKRSSSSRSRSRKKSTSSKSKSTTTSSEKDTAQDNTPREPSGMETIDLDEGVNDAGAEGEGLSPMETVAEAPVAEPVDVAEAQEPAAVSEAAAQDADAAPDTTLAEADMDTPAAEAVPAAAEPAAPVDDAVAVASDSIETEAEQTAEAEETTEDAPKRPIAAASDDDAVVVTGEPGETPAEDTAEAEKTADAEETSGDAEDDAKDDAPAPSSKSKTSKKTEAKDRDETIESVADDDTEEDIRPVRKPRPRRYKIQEVIKVRQIMLVQVVKEERGNKGAALTTYLSLAGRYCVLMPNTARGGGISRKITNATDRSKLKAIANEIDVPKGAGLIIRTAGAKRTKTEIKRDYEYLQRLWEQIRELTLKSVAPAKIYEEGDLIKRSIRDLYSREIDEVLVEGERGYRVAKDFMKMIMPSHAKNVKHYNESMPLFARYQVESYLGGMFNPTVQLKSGGYIVIGVTEALVAIDVNSGRATKEGSIEETAVKTNLEAAEEVARQLRLRDLAGLIVIDFIDMDERKNNAAVEKRLKDKLKTDRARIQVGRISGFGLLEMSRQRLRPGMIEATTQPCAACHGTGLIRSDDNMALQILRQIEEEGVRRRSREVLVKCPVGIANYLMNAKREHIAMIESRYGMAVRIEGDPHLIAPDFSMEKFKTATRAVPDATAPVVSVDTSIMDAIDEAADEAEVEEAQTTETETSTSEEGDEKPKKKRRRRRRKPKSKDSSDSDTGAETTSVEGDTEVKPETTEAPAEGDAPTEEPAEVKAAEDTTEAKPKSTSSRSRSRSRSSSKSKAKETATEATDSPEAEASSAAPTTPEPAAAEAKPEAPAVEAPVEAGSEEAPRPARTRVKASDIIAQMGMGAAAESAPEPEPAQAEEAAAPVVETAEPVSDATEAAPKAEEAEPAKKRRGWWSLGR